VSLKLNDIDRLSRSFRLYNTRLGPRLVACRRVTITNRCASKLVWLLATNSCLPRPTYSSWLNQVEIWFAKIDRDVIARGIFTSVSDLARKLRRYINAYSANARPIQWKYSDTSRRIRTNEFTATGH
jgi:hypothetical protein